MTGRSRARGRCGTWRGLALALVAAAPATAAAADAAAGEAQQARGAALIEPFKRQMQEALRSALAAGPIEAISACRVRAPEIAASLSRGEVRMGRSSHRLRNPDNAAPAWVEPILAQWAAAPGGAERPPRALPLGEGRWGYVEPIATQPLCLACHGEALAPDVASRIRELYPEDRAVGFAPGDLRGVFWVEFPEAP